jgi:hypothetical protein
VSRKPMTVKSSPPLARKYERQFTVCRGDELRDS